MPRHFASVDAMIDELRPDEPVYCLRPEVLRAGARRFIDAFPGKPLFAVKCNPHPEVLRYLHEGGVRAFDAASLAEIALVKAQFPGIVPHFMHPVKSRAAIRAAHGVYGVRHFVVDRMDELEKIRTETRGDSDLTIHVRLATPTAAAAYHLSAKFGARPLEASELLKKVTDYGYGAGLCFHVGSQCLTPNAYRIAVELTREVLDASGVAIRSLDFGGGFPAAYLNQRAPDLEDYMAEIRDCIDWLGLSPAVEILAEPGRVMVADGVSLVAQVQLRKEDQLFLNDGIYGSLSEAVTANLRFPVRALRANGAFDDETFDFTLYGPTCDNTDVLPAMVKLPVDIREGDWLEFGQVGAYSNALRTGFNGFFPETFVTVEAPFDFTPGPYME